MSVVDFKFCWQNLLDLPDFSTDFLQIFRMAPVGTAGEKNATFLSCSPTWDCRSEKCHIFPLQSQLGLQEKNMPFLASAVPPGTIFKTHPKRYCSPNWGCSNADRGNIVPRSSLSDWQWLWSVYWFPPQLTTQCNCFKSTVAILAPFQKMHMKIWSSIGETWTVKTSKLMLMCIGVPLHVCI